MAPASVQKKAALAPAASAAMAAEVEKPSLLLRSVEELRVLSTALSAFTRAFDDLRLLFDSIQTSMDSLSSHLDAAVTSASASAAASPPPGNQVLETGTGGGQAPSSPCHNDDKEKDNVSELDSICKTTVGKSLRKYLNTHMAELDKLREEVPAALSRAPEPAKLVLSCLRRVYLQGKKAFVDPASPMVASRRASILALEFFLLSGRAVLPVEPSVKEEAISAALAWKSRLVTEGGVASASAVDALGLILLVASFGIPSEFGSDVMYDLLRLGNLKKKADVLRHSPILLEKLPDIIGYLVKKEKHPAAADLIIAFGFKEKYPLLPFLSSFLEINGKVGGEERRQGQCSYRSMKEATEKQLAALKSVAKVLECHKLNPSDFESLKLDKKMAKLEKEISKFDNKLQNLKRKPGETGPSNKVEKTQAKIPRPGSSEAAREKAGPLVRPTEEYYPDSMNIYNRLPPRNFSDDGIPGLLGCGVVLHAGNMPLTRTSVGMAPAASDSLVSLGASLASYAGSGLPVGNCLGSLTNSNSGYYRWHGEGATINDHSITQSMLGFSPLARNSYIRVPEEMGNRGSGSDLYRFADSVLESELKYGRSSTASAGTEYRPSYLW